MLALLPAVAGAWGPPRSGGLGAQTMRGGPGADYLRGAEGPDDVRGHGGADLLTGDTGPDSVSGGAGSDTISGAAGIDILRGGTGNDIVTGGFGADVIHGGPGADALAGDNDTDTLSGDDGDDVLHGGSGADHLDGGDGDDRIFSDTGADAIDGGPGRDTIVVDGSAFVRTTCGPGRDTLYVVVAADATADYAGRGILATWSGDCEDVKVTDSLADPNKGMTYLAPDGGGARTGGARDDILLGGPGADVLRGADGRDVLWGLRQPGVQSVAADLLDGGDGDDTIYGGPGPQTITGGAGDDFLEGGVGDGTISGGRGDDTIRLRGAGLTSVDAGAGNDKVHARGTARARIRCGSGRDIAYADAGDRVGRDCERRVGLAVRRALPRATYADALGATPGLVHWWRLGKNPDSTAYRFNEISDTVGGAKGSWVGGQHRRAGRRRRRRYGVGELGHAGMRATSRLASRRRSCTASSRSRRGFALTTSAARRARCSPTRGSGSIDGVVLVREIDGSLRASIASSTDGGAGPAAHAGAEPHARELAPHRAHARRRPRRDLRRWQSQRRDACNAHQDQRDLVWLRRRAELRPLPRLARERSTRSRARSPARRCDAVRGCTAGDDGGAPVARVDPPLAAVLPNTAVVNLDADRPGASFRCARDEVEFYGPCKPRTPLFGLPDGDHELRMIATSRTGVAQATPTVVRFRLDARIPGTLLVLRLSPDGDGRAIASFGSAGAWRLECRGHRGYLRALGGVHAADGPRAKRALRGARRRRRRQPRPVTGGGLRSGLGTGVTGAWGVADVRRRARRGVDLPRAGRRRPRRPRPAMSRRRPRLGGVLEDAAAADPRRRRARAAGASDGGGRNGGDGSDHLERRARQRSDGDRRAAGTARARA